MPSMLTVTSNDFVWFLMTSVRVRRAAKSAVVLAKSHVTDKLGIVAFSSIPIRPSIVRSDDLVSHVKGGVRGGLYPGIHVGAPAFPSSSPSDSRSRRSTANGARPILNRLDRFFWTTLHRCWPRWADVLIIVKPETVIGWRRAGFRLFWRWHTPPCGCRPKITAEIRGPIRRLKQDNADWGAPKIHGELLKLGFKVSEWTVARYLGDCGGVMVLVSRSLKQPSFSKFSQGAFCSLYLASLGGGRCFPQLTDSGSRFI
jgi:hypothetical protein